ncbi:LAMI_0H10484g1_1 [Lachancea mirantina]|uniref:LAMI_0H10484g1_1 n=1 Tax=Lachancea mirantina TaxID=1230905 RepID=A0A1G4KH03_9SACH|nr:LAMI_0H10484g1_1 [Lachancea mirantina]
MSLIVYGRTSGPDESSVILHDPSSHSLVILNRISGEISLVRRIRNAKPGLATSDNVPAISAYCCPQCGSEIGTHTPIDETRFFVHKNYFKLLEQQETITSGELLEHAIPSNLFTPGYYRRFFRELSVLGNGARGSVYKVEHVLMNNHLGIYALKKIPIGNDLSWLELGMREVKFLTSLTHSSANLITYNHVWLEMDVGSGIVNTRSGEGKKPTEIPYVFILQKYCPGGNLEETIQGKVYDRLSALDSPEVRKRKFKQRRHLGKTDKQTRGLTNSQLISIMRDLASGLQELHDLNIIHRDLKPSNCLLLEEFSLDKADYMGKPFPTVVIGDFGESQLSGQLRAATGATGTLEFTAPEVLIMDSDEEHSFSQFTFNSDMYSLGMICYFLIFGELPFPEHSTMKALKYSIKQFHIDIDRVAADIHRKRGAKIDKSLLDLMVVLLSPKEEERPSAREVVQFLNQIDREPRPKARETIDTAIPPLESDKQRIKPYQWLLGRIISEKVVMLVFLLNMTMFVGLSTLSRLPNSIRLSYAFVLGISIHSSSDKRLRNAAFIVLGFLIILYIDRYNPQVITSYKK